MSNQARAIAIHRDTLQNLGNRELGQNFIDHNCDSLKVRFHKIHIPDKSRQLPTTPDNSRQVPTNSRQVPTIPDNSRQTHDKSRQLPTSPDKSRQVPTSPDKSQQVPTSPNKSRQARRTLTDCSSWRNVYHKMTLFHVAFLHRSKASNSKTVIISCLIYHLGVACESTSLLV